MGATGVLDGTIGSAAGAGLGAGGLGAALRFGAALFLGAALRFRAVFLLAGLRLAAALRFGAFFLRAGFREALRAVALLLPRLAVFFRFALFFAKLPPPFL